MDEVTELGTAIERADGVARQRPKAHRRDVEHRHRIRLGTPLAHHHAKVRRSNARGRKRMANPLVPGDLHIQFGAERAAVDFALGALVDDAALGTRERTLVGVVLNEVLADFRADELEQEAEVAPQRVVAQHRVARLRDVVDTQQHQQTRDECARPMQVSCGPEPGGDDKQQHNTREGPIATRQHDKPCVETNQGASITDHARPA